MQDVLTLISNNQPTYQVFEIGICHVFKINHIYSARYVTSQGFENVSIGYLNFPPKAGRYESNTYTGAQTTCKTTFGDSSNWKLNAEITEHSYKFPNRAGKPRIS